MSIEIKISGENFNEALSELRGFAGGLAGGMVTSSKDAESPVAEELPADEAKAFPEPKKRGRPSARQAETRVGTAEMFPAKAEDVEADDSPAEEAKPFTVDDARAALQDLLAQPDGKDKARAILSEMGVAKISEIPEGQLKAFIAAVAKQRGL